jgi:5-methylcytosine-specific restriction endonuclease McrA
MNAYSKEYERRNKDRRRARDEKRAQAGEGSRVAFDDAVKRELFRKQNGLCPCCGKSIRSATLGEVDHMIPLARGGKHDARNFMLTHRQCNKEKHNKTLVEHWNWRVRVGLDEENLGRKLGLIK